MSWNIAPECISLVILGIIGVYARKGSHLPTLKNRVFQGCLLVTFCAMASNILSTLLLYKSRVAPLWLTNIVTTVYYLLTPLMGLAYFLYAVSVIYPEGRQLRRIVLLGVVPAVGYAVMVLINPFTGLLFYLDRQLGYVRGPWVMITYLLFYLYCVASIAVTVLGRRRVPPSVYRILAAFPVLAVLVIVVQQVYPNIILSGSAATCAMLIIYLHLQNKQISQDYLTGVPNRQELLDMLELIVKRQPGVSFTLVVVSLRDFRQINSAYGQQRGDELLCAVCRFLSRVGPRENVYRFSGDEFALLFYGDGERQARGCVEAVQQRMTETWMVGDLSFTLPAVMGIMRRQDDSMTLENIISAVEYAVARAKTGRYGKICYCDQAMLAELERRRSIVNILKERLQKREVELYYQPIYSVEDGSFRYAESLMRIPDSSIGPIYPSEFIPIAEETGLIVEMTYLVLDKVCKFVNRLLAQSLDIGAVHVNFSALQFSQPDLADRVLDIIHQNGTPLSAIKIEFTESTLAESTEVVASFAREMERHGLLIGLDDFGTGYSNIATVISIPFDTLKFDKSLVWASIDSEKSARTVKNLVHTFKDLGMVVVAEGVEDLAQSQLVENFGVDQIQGFYYARPMPAKQTEQFLSEHVSAAAGAGRHTTA
ncbi:bifunctional diguanylate cyclase/phosphodiesterase [Neobittarella massiliensis]|uniref:putative bifunctional diguanylate cyclase/phosphodiesterase n=1 Tax=Neobittarella massiliensis (ex Bilen et al. 2018) TaxID=2041842 RepID=UPI000CF5F421|nr:EAL domain-containing protein [Neobittarella massiliensis]